MMMTGCIVGTLPVAESISRISGLNPLATASDDSPLAKA